MPVELDPETQWKAWEERAHELEKELAQSAHFESLFHEEEQQTALLRQELAAVREELERMKDTGGQYFDKAVTLNEKREKALAIIDEPSEYSSHSVIERNVEASRKLERIKHLFTGGEP